MGISSMTGDRPAITGVVLAGGQSRRMGRDKRFIELGGLTLLDRVCAVLAEIFNEVLVVVAEPTPALRDSPHRVVIDKIPGCATLGGLYTGLGEAKHNRVFAVACDMPFLNKAVIGRMIDLGSAFDVVMARLGDRLQPMHAIYSKACQSHMYDMIKRSNLKLQDLAANPELRVKVIEERELRSVDRRLLSFMNVNTPSDLEFARKWLEGRGSKPEPTA